MKLFRWLKAKDRTRPGRETGGIRIFLLILVRLHHLQLSKPLAWGLGTFIWAWLFYLIPS